MFADVFGNPSIPRMNVKWTRISKLALGRTRSNTSITRASSLSGDDEPQLSMKEIAGGPSLLPYAAPRVSPTNVSETMILEAKVPETTILEPKTSDADISETNMPETPILDTRVDTHKL